MNCEICGEWGNVVTLCGDVPTALCVRCRREWGRLCRAHPAYAKYLAADLAVAGGLAILSGGGRTLDGLPILGEELRDRTKEMAAVAEAWLEQRLEERKKEQACKK